MRTLIVLQAAFCFVVLFVAGLFATTFDRLSSQPLGFSAERLLNLETVARRPQPPVVWDQVAERLRAAPGVETVAMTVWPLMSGESWVGTVSVDGGTPSEVLSDLLQVSPGWFEAMRIPLIGGRDLRADDGAGAAIVNQAFAKQFFGGENPVGKWFESGHVRYQVVGLVRDARSRDRLRRPILPTAYFPLHSAETMARGTYVVRTRGENPMALASNLRQEVPRAGSGLYVTNIRTQAEIIQACSVRERLLAMLAVFFAGVALLLAGIGLYGVLDYGVVQRRREIGIHIAVGAQASDIARHVTAETFAMLLGGAAVGLALGLASLRYIETLLYEVKGSDLSNLVTTSLAMLSAAMVATLPAVLRAVRTDPVKALRVQ